MSLLDDPYVTGFGDEISPDLDVQLAAMRRLGVGGLDLRSAFGKNVLQLSDSEADKVGDACRRLGISIQTISSPVNKVRYSPAARAEELRKLGRAIDLAARLNIRKIRIFSPETPDGEGYLAADKSAPSRDPLWPEVRGWMAEQIAFAKSRGAILLHENDGHFFGAMPNNARLLLEELGDANAFRAIYDFGNAVLIGCQTMRDWFPWLLPHLDTLHLKDAILAERRFVPAGEGDGECEACFAALHEFGWNGPLTLEPHAQVAGPSGGFSGEQAFEHSIAALRSALARAAQRARAR